MGVVFTAKVFDYRGNVDSAVQSAINKALETCGGLAETYAKDLCPKNTGNLQNSITHAKVDDMTMAIGSNVEYAPYVELGHMQEPGRYVPAIGKRLVKDHVDAKPYLRPAIEEHVDDYRRVIEAELQVLGK